MDAHEIEVKHRQRFEFGSNWRKFLQGVGEKEVAAASSSPLTALGCKRLDGSTFLDVGSGSGLSSLAAWRSGAHVVAFDFDPESVACTLELRRRRSAPEAEWTVLRGSILDRTFLASLGTFDIVYSWGVLHHTGAMWEAIDNAASLVGPEGRLFIAIYNDQGAICIYWRLIKKMYNRWPVWRVLLLAVRLPYFCAVRAAGSIARRLRRKSHDLRGMHFMRDVVNWLGGYPFEVASMDDVVRRVRSAGFSVVYSKSVGRRSGCNELVFQRDR
ncbi:MAG: hypothetical protein AMXMBFR8_12050 [Nevskiales bacterium]